MSGDLIAAESPDDQRVLVHLLQRQGVLRRKVVTELEGRLEASESIFGELLKYAGAALDTPLYHRFENNLATFLGGLGKPSFAPLKGVFVDNIQMGHVTLDLIDRACALWDQASALDVDTPVIVGHIPFDNDQQLWVAKAVGRGERTVSAVLLDLPMEELHARTVILEMLAKGMISVAGAEPEVERDEPTETGPDDGVEDQETVYGIDAAALRAALEGDDAPAADEPVVDSDADDRVISGNTLVPTSFEHWMEQASSVDDDELDFFQDHDHDRGSADDGAFSTESHNLDRVEVVGLDDAPIEADEAPATRFGAPVLSEDEAFEKIAVINEVLAHVIAAFDSAEGNGRGRAVVQLLVDGSPSNFASLLHDLKVGKDGELPDDVLLENLYSRPATEHRQLINNALSDLVERALSSAADQLPDEQFDTMYEQVAGYRQRMGL